MNFGLLSRDIIEGLSDSFCGQLLELVCFPTVRAVVCVRVYAARTVEKVAKRIS